MKFFLLFFSILIFTFTVLAQDLTVHVVDDKRISQPLAYVVVRLVEMKQSPGRRKQIVHRSDQKGDVLFHDVDITHKSWQVVIWNTATASDDPSIALASPENAVLLKEQIVSDPIISVLPAEITIHVRKRGFGERLDFIFRGP